MAFPFRRILCPVALDDSAMDALEMAADVARQNDGTIFVLHVVPMSIEPTDSPVYVYLYKDQRESARAKLEQIGHKHLTGLTYQLLTEMGDPADLILKAAKRERVDNRGDGHPWARRFCAAAAWKCCGTSPASIKLPGSGGAARLKAEAPRGRMDDAQPRHCYAG